MRVPTAGGPLGRVRTKWIHPAPVPCTVCTVAKEDPPPLVVVRARSARCPCANVVDPRTTVHPAPAAPGTTRAESMRQGIRIPA
jgi:hypothetical protein